MSFVDYYEVLEVSPNANADTIERIFRYLAQRYHPDNPASGNRVRFDLVLEAYNTLRDAERRAQYDVEHRRQVAERYQLARDVGDTLSIDGDAEFQNRLLSLFYVKRRKSVGEPGIGDGELAILMDCPLELLDFHLWYLKEKRWISRREDGLLAITIEGVERASSENHTRAAAKLLTDQS